MRGKSPPSEHILEKIKSHNSSGFLREFVKGDSFILSKYHFSYFVYFNKYGKTQQNKYLTYGILRVIGHMSINELCGIFRVLITTNFFFLGIT